MAITRSEQGEANTFKSKEDLLCFTKTFWLAVSGLASSLFSREPVWISELKIFIAIYAMWVPFTHSKTPATPLHPHCNAALPAFRSHTHVLRRMWLYSADTWLTRLWPYTKDSYSFLLLLFGIHTVKIHRRSTTDFSRDSIISQIKSHPLSTWWCKVSSLIVTLEPVTRCFLISRQ